jgi:hypothetical protein
MRTVGFLIRHPGGDNLVKILEKAIDELAAGGGDPSDAKRHYGNARKELDKYTETLGRLADKGDVLPSIAADLLDDAAALISAVDALIGA